MVPISLKCMLYKQSFEATIILICDWCSQGMAYGMGYATIKEPLKKVLVGK